MPRLCNDTFAKAAYDADGDDSCPVHQTDACLADFVPMDDEWATLRQERDDAVTAAQIAVRRLRKARQEIDDALSAITKPRARLMGTYPPLVMPADDAEHKREPVDPEPFGDECTDDDCCGGTE